VDSDGDGVLDAIECGNPPPRGCSNRVLPDSDGDGLSDGEEDSNRSGAQDPGETHVRKIDTDGDRYEDGIEQLGLATGAGAGFPTDPLDPSDPPLAFVDGDGDGLPRDTDPDDQVPDLDTDRFLDSYEATQLGTEAMLRADILPMLGDVEGNGIRDNADAQRILNFFAQVETSGTDPGRCDLDRDGVVDNADAQLSLAYFIQSLGVLPFRRSQ
jgi:hypothetical protein